MNTRTNLVEVENLSQFFGNFQALNELAFSIPQKAGVIGLIGPNGAGKTTLIHALLGQFPVSQGTIRLGSQRIAYCPDTPEFPKSLTAAEVLQQSLLLNGQADNFNQIKTVLQKVSLTKFAKKQVGGFSRGMKQRLGIAVALLLDPELIILDEPTSALDPLGRTEVLQLISEVAQEKTVIVSSHLLADIEKIAQDLLVLNNGVLLYKGATEAFLTVLDNFGEVEVKNKQDKVIVIKALRKNQVELIEDLTEHAPTKIVFKETDEKRVLALLPQVAELVKSYRATTVSLDLAFEEAIRQTKEEVVK